MSNQGGSNARIKFKGKSALMKELQRTAAFCAHNDVVLELEGSIWIKCASMGFTVNNKHQAAMTCVGLLQHNSSLGVCPTPDARLSLQARPLKAQGKG